MGLGSFWCYVWWFVCGAFAGWLLWWLIDKLFLRDTETPARLVLAEAELEESRAAQALQLAEIEELRVQARTASVRAIEISSLKTELDNRKGLEQAYEAEYNKVVEQHDAKVRELTASADEIAKLKSDLAAADAVRAELTDVRSRFEASQQELSGATSRFAISEARSAEATELNKKLELASATAASQSREIERLKTEWSAASAHSAGAARLKLDLDERTEQVRRLEQEIDSLKAVLLDSKHALEKQMAEIARLKGELASVAGRSDAEARLEAELAASRASEGRLRSELTAATVRIANLERLRLALDAARQASEGHASEVARLNAEFHASMAAMEESTGSKS